MMTLLYKEMRLAAHPTSIVFAFLGCLVLVPSYPYSVVFMFGCLAPYITFLNARETNDVWYTAVLPVTKRESVLGKCLLVVFFQLFQLLFSIPFALLRNTMNIANNPVGLDATVAWYGCIFRPSESKETVGVSPPSREKQVQVHGRESTGVLFGKKWQRNAS